MPVPHEQQVVAIRIELLRSLLSPGIGLDAVAQALRERRIYS
jgi:uncharacterized protein YoaH (UPF0181 family)